MQDMYYRSPVTSRRRSRRSKRNQMKFLTPLVFIFAIIIAIWLLMKLWGFLADLTNGNLDESAQIFIVDGKAQVESFGNEDFSPLFSGQVLLEGDRIRTLTDSRAVIKIFEDTEIRLDESTDLTLSLIEKSGDDYSVNVKVNAGDVWVNRRGEVDLKSNLVVASNYLSVTTSGTVFAIHSGLPEAVRIIDGQVLVDVVSIDGETLDSINLGVGQELLLTADSLEAFMRRETPSVLDAVDASFQQSEWYEWNTEEDANPTEFAVDPALDGDSNVEIDDSTGDDTEVDEPVEVEPEIDAPVITSPVNRSTVSDETVYIEGSAPDGAEKIVVTSFEEGKAVPYVLKAFQPGDSTWRYIATYDSGDGNLVVGENTFEVVAIDAEGNESDAAKVVFTYEIDAETTEVDAPSDLTAPRVTEVNDETVGSKYVLPSDESRAVIIGSVGTWAQSVTVNGFKLTLYKPYSGSFSYILSTEFSNLEKGDNVLEIVATDADGNKSPAGEFVVNWE